MDPSKRSAPALASLLRVMGGLRGEEKGKLFYDFDIGMKEYASIGYVMVHWAFLEYALYKRTAAFAKRAKVPIPKDANNFSFSRRLRVLRELILLVTKDKKSKERWLNLLSRVANAEGTRHKIAHGLWTYNPRRIEQLWALSRNSKRVEPLDIVKMGEFGWHLGGLSFELLNPRPGSGRPRKDQPQTFAYASRSFLLAMQGKDPDSLGLSPTMPAKPEPPQSSSED